MSESVAKSFQQVVDLNLQLTQVSLEQTTLVGKEVLSAVRQSDLLTAAVAHTQPASETLRAYQQHIALSCEFSA
jgi:hypothetical protein